MNHYEIALIVNPDVPEKEVEKIAQETRDLLAGMQAVTTGTRIERRPLAYPIKRWTEAHYIFIECDAPTAMPQTIQRELRHREGLIRMAFVRKPLQPEMPTEPTPVEPPAEQSDVEPTAVTEPVPEADNG